MRSSRVFTSRPLLLALCLVAAAAAVVVSVSVKTDLAATCSLTSPPAGRAREQGRYRALDAKQLIPGVPSGLVVCRYQGSEKTGWEPMLQAVIPVGRGDIARVAAATRTPLGPQHSCPLEASAHQTYLIAGFPDAPDLVIDIADHCGLAGNGTRSGAFTTPAAERAILAALPGRLTRPAR